MAQQIATPIDPGFVAEPPRASSGVHERAGEAVTVDRAGRYRPGHCNRSRIFASRRWPGPLLMASSTAASTCHLSGNVHSAAKGNNVTLPKVSVVIAHAGAAGVAQVGLPIDLEAGLSRHHRADRRLRSGDPRVRTHRERILRLASVPAHARQCPVTWAGRREAPASWPRRLNSWPSGHHAHMVNQQAAAADGRTSSLRRAGGLRCRHPHPVRHRAGNGFRCRRHRCASHLAAGLPARTRPHT